MANTSSLEKNSALKPVRNIARQMLVIAFDIGVKYSSVSYSILDPGKVPTIWGVKGSSRNEGVDPSAGSKIPSVMYYDAQGKVVAAGEESLQEGVELDADKHGWVKVEWFILHIRGSYNQARQGSLADIPPLPRNKTAVQVYGDFIQYLMKRTVAYIKDNHTHGARLWESLKDSIAFVISYPDDWEGVEQSRMRQAAVYSGLIENTRSGHAQLTFITKGEASLYSAIEQGTLKDADLKHGDGVVVVDAGEGTIGVSAYIYYGHVDLGQTLAFESTSIPQSYFQGSTFVTIRARDYLKELLANSEYFEDIEHITRCFNEGLKLHFRDSDNPQFIKFGSVRDNDPEVNIRYGLLKLPGMVVAQFFQPSIDCIVKAAKEIANQAGKLMHVALIGQFSSNEWLYSQVRNLLHPWGINVVRVEPLCCHLKGFELWLSLCYRTATGSRSC